MYGIVIVIVKDNRVQDNRSGFSSISLIQVAKDRTHISYKCNKVEKSPLRLEAKVTGSTQPIKYEKKFLNHWRQGAELIPRGVTMDPYENAEPKYAL